MNGTQSDRASWEAKFTQWSKSASKSEEERCESAIRAVRNAVNHSAALKNRNITVFVQGSYRNRVNVRRDSDVDIGVCCFDVFTPVYPEGLTHLDFGNLPATYRYSTFKDEVGEALRDQFSASSVHRGSKAFDVRQNSYRVEADVVPLFEHRHYFENGAIRHGVSLRPDSGGQIENYPERVRDDWPSETFHYENGVSKNDATHRAYKGIVRVLKSLRNEMADAGMMSASPIPGFLLECLAWNVPDSHFNHVDWDSRLQNVLLYLWANTKPEVDLSRWHEVNEVKYLFHQSQKWSQDQAHTFISAAWSYVGIRS